MSSVAPINSDRAMISSETAPPVSPDKFVNEFDVSQTESDSYDSQDILTASPSSADGTIKKKKKNKQLQQQKRGEKEIDPIAIVFQDNHPSEMVEPTTGILYPGALNASYQLMGCGVRTKYLVIHAYAVGLYLDSSCLKNLQTDQDVQQVLLDPKYPKIFRLVLNRNVTSAQYLGASMDALTPLMRGRDLDKYVSFFLVN